MPPRSAWLNSTPSGMTRKMSRNSTAMATSPSRIHKGSRSAGTTGRRGLSSATSGFMPPPRPGLQQIDRQQHQEGDRQHDHGECHGAGIIVLLELDDDQQR